MTVTGRNRRPLKVFDRILADGRLLFSSLGPPVLVHLPSILTSDLQEAAAVSGELPPLVKEVCLSESRSDLLLEFDPSLSMWPMSHSL